MKKITRPTLSLTLALLISCTPYQSYTENPNVITAEAHSGRTDSNGGHRDNKNKSGLGSYHYHCGGHPAHLHTNGLCPYSSNSSQGTNETTSPTIAETAPEIVIPDNIGVIFDKTYYYENNPDLQTAIGDDYDKLVKHFVESGMAEGRASCAAFNVHVYRENNPDLVESFGDDLSSYYHHYMNSGCHEGRVAK